MARSNFGHIQYVSKNKYRVYWDIAPDPETGRRRQRTKTVNGTRDDAEVYLARQRVDGGVSGDMPWSRYWALAVEPTFRGLQPKTVADYRRVWEVELKPRIAGDMVGATTWRRVEAVLGEIRSPSVQRHAYALWRKMCNLAVRDGLLQRSPVDRSIRLKPAKKREKRILAREEVLPFLDAIRGLKYEPLWLMEVGGGLRHEEACAMLWECVSEWDGYALISVERALPTVNGRKVLKDTKNAFSVREAVMGEPFASRLLELKGAGAVCPGANPGAELGESWFANPATVTHNWRAWCGRHGVEYIRPSDMRSCYATLHGEAGSLDSLVSLSMGHADGTTRGANYQQRTRDGLRLIADSLAEYLLRDVAR